MCFSRRIRHFRKGVLFQDNRCAFTGAMKVSSELAPRYQSCSKRASVWTGGNEASVEKSDPRGLNDRAVEARKGLLHQRLPRVLSPRLGRLCQHHRVAYQLDPNQTELTVKVASCVSVRALGGILCAKRSLSSQRYATVDLLLGPIRSPHKPVATRELRYQVHEANPAGTYLKTY